MFHEVEHWWYATCPDAPVGRHLLADATLIPAPTQQRSSRDRNGRRNEALERRLTRHHPDARFVARGRRINGKTDISDRLRGWKLNVLKDAVTGVPLAWALSPATQPEAEALPALLEQVFAGSPYLPVETVTADKAYDTEAVIEECMTRFGVTVVTRLRQHREGVGIPRKYRGAVLRVDKRGIAHCEHGPLDVESFQTPSRLSLAAGDEVGARHFRARFRSACGCGRPSLPLSTNWSLLSQLPHHPYGRPDLYAQRLALLAARQRIEATFAGLKVGYRGGRQGQCPAPGARLDSRGGAADRGVRRPCSARRRG